MNTKKFETVVYRAPSSWESYWINSDASGLDDIEIAAADKAFERIIEAHPGAGPHPVDCEDAGFCSYCDFGRMPGDMSDYTFLYEVAQ